MEILDLKNNVPVIHPAALQIPVFKKLWTRDKSKTKTKALNELTYIYFVADYKSDFSDIIDEKERKEEVSKIVDVKEDEVVTEAIEFYKARQVTLSMHLLHSAKIGVDKIRKYVEDVDLSELDDKGKPIHNVSQINTLLSNLGNTIEGIRKLEAIVAKEIEDNTRIRGGGEVGMFEDPN